MYKRLLLLALQLAFLVAIAVFAGQRFKELTSAIEPELIFKKPVHLGLSALGYLAFYALLARHWQLLSEKFTGQHRPRQWLAFFASQPYKYLPSSLFTFSARAAYAKKLGLSVKASTVAQLIENANILIGGVLVAVLFMAFQTSMMWGLAACSLTMLIIGGVLMNPRLQISKNGFQLSGREWVKLFVLPIGAWLFAGTSLYILVTATGHDITLLSAVIANSLAVALGILAVFAPGGIGVREFVYAQFAISTVGIVVWRLLTLAVDVAVGFAAIYAIRHLKNSKDAKS